MVPVKFSKHTDLLEQNKVPLSEGKKLNLGIGEDAKSNRLISLMGDAVD